MYVRQENLKDIICTYVPIQFPLMFLAKEEIKVNAPKN